MLVFPERRDAPLLARSCSYLNGATGKTCDMERYVKHLKENLALSLTIDQVVIHVDGDTAVVSARAWPRPSQTNRYLETYERRGHPHRRGPLPPRECGSGPRRQRPVSGLVEPVQLGGGQHEVSCRGGVGD